MRQKISALSLSFSLLLGVLQAHAGFIGPDPHDSDQYGNKAANLIVLERIANQYSQSKTRIQIPEILPLSHQFVRSHLDKIAPEWRLLWNTFLKEQGDAKISLKASALPSLRELQRLILENFKSRPVPLTSEMQAFIEKMEAKHVDLMVRSTGKEDDITTANPGGNTSVVAVHPDLRSISSAIGVVVASYFSEKSLSQRLQSPPPANDISGDPFMPVLLQRMIGERVYTSREEIKQVSPSSIIRSGVLYVRNGFVTVQAAPGHGELIVNSKGPFDSYFVSKQNRVYPTLLHKKYRLAPIEEQGERNLEFVPNPKALVSQSSLPISKAVDLAEVGRAIEIRYQVPMDVEWVYDPAADILYLVQARPIPVGKRGKYLPSSFPPEQIPLLKKDPKVQIQKGTIISPADRAAKVITRNEEVLLATNIGSALNYYLALENPIVKAVIVQDPAPNTSHEAAQFNAIAIPVLQVPQIQRVQDWIDEASPILILDPQRNQIVRWTDKGTGSKDPERDLFQKGILQIGLFRSPLAPQVTLAQEFSNEELTRSFGAFADAIGSKNVPRIASLSPLKPYSQLEEILDTLDAAKPGQPNPGATSALLATQFYLFRLTGQNQKDPLFRHAVIFAADLKRHLDTYSAIPASTSQGEKDQARSDWLDHVSKLSALITNPGDELLVSDSLYQRAQEKKDVHFAEKHLTSSDSLSAEKMEYFVEWVKLKKVILRSSFQEAWVSFIKEALKDSLMTQQLSKLILFMAENHISSDVLNILFPELVSRKVSAQQILVGLGKECGETKVLLDRLGLDQVKAAIQGWERRKVEWGNPEAFGKLFREYQKEIPHLIQHLNVQPGDPRLVRKAVFNTVLELTELMDTTIKSMKGSAEYNDEARKVLQVERFVLLLGPYFDLMVKWMDAIDAHQYDLWESKVRALARMDKAGMIAAIRKAFEDLKSSRDPRQLNSSGGFSVASARIGGSASFYLQFVRKQKHLEDLFSLFHQNILASIAFLGVQDQIKTEHIPEFLIPLVTEFARPESLSPKRNMQFELLSISHPYPELQLEYNLALRNHGAKALVTYHPATGKVSLRGNLFGNNWGGFMMRAFKLLRTESVLFEGYGIHTKLAPTYNPDSYQIEVEYEWDAERTQLAAAVMKRSLMHYGEIPFGPGEDSKTFFYPFQGDTETLYELRMGALDALATRLLQGKNVDANWRVYLQDIREALLQSLPRDFSREEHEDFGRRLVRHHQFFLDSIHKNYGSKNLSVADALEKAAEFHLNQALIGEAGSQSHLTPEFTQLNQQKQVREKRTNTYREEAKKVLSSLLSKSIPIFRLSPRNLKYLVLDQRISRDKKGDPIDLLNQLYGQPLGVSEISRRFPGDKKAQVKALNEVLPFTFLGVPTQSAQEWVAFFIKDYLHRQAHVVRNLRNQVGDAHRLLKMIENREPMSEVVAQMRRLTQITGPVSLITHRTKFVRLLDVLLLCLDHRVGGVQEISYSQ